MRLVNWVAICFLKRVAFSPCHLLLRTWCGSDCIRSCVHLFTFPLEVIWMLSGCCFNHADFSGSSVQYIWETYHIYRVPKVSDRKNGANSIQQKHYETMPIQIYWKFYHQTNEDFRIKNSDIFHISAQNIDCGHSLEPPQRGGSNEYPQSMFLSRNKKNNEYPCKPQFYYIKVGFKGIRII